MRRDDEPKTNGARRSFKRILSSDPLPDDQQQVDPRVEALAFNLDFMAAARKMRSGRRTRLEAGPERRSAAPPPDIALARAARARSVNAETTRSIDRLSALGLAVKTSRRMAKTREHVSLDGDMGPDRRQERREKLRTLDELKQDRLEHERNGDPGRRFLRALKTKPVPSS